MLQFLKQNLIKTFLLTTLPLFSIMSGAIAQPKQPYLTASNSACVCDPADPFDPKAKMPQGIYKGQCLYCQQRSVQLLTPVEAAPYKPRPGAIVFANFKHKNKFWVAQIPPNAVEDAIFQIQYYTVPASPYIAHGQIRFRLKPGYEAILVPQSRSSGKADKAIRVRDMVYVANGVGLKSAAWNPVTGVFDFYAIAQEMIALEDRIEDAFNFKFTDRVEQIRLALTPRQKQQILLNAIAQSSRDQTNVMYDTISRNCTTLALRVVDSTIGYIPEKYPKEQQEYFVNLPTGPQLNEALANKKLNPETLNEFLAEQIKKLPALQLPTAPYDALLRRELVNSRSKMPTLEQEFAAQYGKKKR
ncbi:MAG: hypothetical protein CLLPBCKN_000017 [Chroococcidiopsis cubana SAG 39.79]|nr:DUF4105 domain-containing protein [Chroococcidiopsis cubana]MDZ4870629.1 hypothetical protein [Chroococcidiopsis cubana SAG 39.79]PSB61115.1 hypothetical protein C7B79_23220 [Chroococcidiopsis cubana CCALA 043]